MVEEGIYLLLEKKIAKEDLEELFLDTPCFTLETLDLLKEFKREFEETELSDEEPTELKPLSQKAFRSACDRTNALLYIEVCAILILNRNWLTQANLQMEFENCACLIPQ